MFIAVEISHAPAANYGTQLEADDLYDALEAINKTGKGEKLFRALYPDGDGDFMANIKAILQEDSRRRKTDRPMGIKRLNPKVKHETWHELESIFWVALYGLARARPLGEDDHTTTEYDDFCKAMLGHCVAQGKYDGPRAGYLFYTPIHGLFHPRLQPFEHTLHMMARYLSIPWYLYRDKVDELHAFTAFRRLLLNLVATTDPQDLDIELDTARPRVADIPGERYRSQPVIPSTRASTSNFQPAGLPIGRQGSTSTKRKAEDADNTAHLAKKSKSFEPKNAPAIVPALSPAAQQTASTSSTRRSGREATRTNTAAVDQRADARDAAKPDAGIKKGEAKQKARLEAQEKAKKRKRRQEVKYIPEVHKKCRTVNVTRLKFVNDEGWFRPGEPLETQTAAVPAQEG